MNTFVAGPSRSGTTASTRYMNEHPEILACRERYKWIPLEEVNSRIFTFEKTLGFEKKHERRRRVHAEFLSGKDPATLSFVLTSRRIEEIAGFFEAGYRSLSLLKGLRSRWFVRKTCFAGRGTDAHI